MARKKQEPTVVVHTQRTHIVERTESHPAYAQIGASRVTAQPGEFLYGSDFRHRNFVVIRIGDSEMNRSLSHDWPHSHKEYIEVALSEAQWASFVSSLNMGQGTQCTLLALGGRDIPGIASVESRKEQFKRELGDKLHETERALATLRKQIDESKLSGAAKKELLDTLVTANNNLAPNLDYVAKTFGEYVEAVTEKAKIEVNAHVQNVLQRAGIDALKAVAPFELPEEGEPE